MIRERCPDEIALLESPVVGEHRKRAAIWKIKTGLYAEFALPPYEGMVIHYEQLVRETDVVIKELVCGVELDPGRLMPHDRVMQGVGPGLTHRNRRIDDRSIGRWRTCFSDKAEREVWEIGGPLMRELGYERTR
jgi:hypothetical protein